MDKVESLRTDLNFLKESGWTWTDLAVESKVERTWLQKFASGLISEPTVTRYDILKATTSRLKRRAQNGSQEPK